MLLFVVKLVEIQDQTSTSGEILSHKHFFYFVLEKVTFHFIHFIVIYFFLSTTRFHNNTVMEMQTEGTLVLRDLRPQQAGEYYCKASGASGTIKSKSATLKVIGMLV